MIDYHCFLHQLTPPLRPHHHSPPHPPPASESEVDVRRSFVSLKMLTCFVVLMKQETVWFGWQDSRLVLETSSPEERGRSGCVPGGTVPGLSLTSSWRRQEAIWSWCQNCNICLVTDCLHVDEEAVLVWRRSSRLTHTMTSWKQFKTLTGRLYSISFSLKHLLTSGNTRSF